MNPDNNKVLTHTRFRIPLDVDISDIEAGYEKELPVFMSLNPLLAAPGRIQSFWSRIAEKPEEVMLITAWRTQQAFTDFESSPTYTEYFRGLSAGGMSPHTVSVDVGRQMIQAVLGLGSPTSMMMIYFPALVTQEQRSRFLEISGLVGSVAYDQSSMHLRKSSSSPVRGWMLGEQERGASSYEVGMMWHFWRSAEMEKKFKQEDLVRATTTGEKVIERFERELKEIGAEMWDEIHCRFVSLPRQACPAI